MVTGGGALWPGQPLGQASQICAEALVSQLLHCEAWSCNCEAWSNEVLKRTAGKPELRNVKLLQYFLVRQLEIDIKLSVSSTFYFYIFLFVYLYQSRHSPPALNILQAPEAPGGPTETPCQ